MAGIIKVDRVQSDSNLAFNIAGANVAFMDATSLQMVGSNVSLAGTNVITNGKVVRTGMPVGAVLQVVNTTYTSTFSQSIVDRAKLNNISVSITPTSATSKMLVMCGIFFEGATADHNWHFFLYRDSTDISSPSPGSRGAAIAMAGLGYFDSDNDSTPAMVNFHYFDSPSTTSTITYAPGVGCSAGTSTIYINRTLTDGNTIGYERGISSITVMEIAA